MTPDDLEVINERAEAVLTLAVTLTKLTADPHPELESWMGAYAKVRGLLLEAMRDLEDELIPNPVLVRGDAAVAGVQHTMESQPASHPEGGFPESDILQTYLDMLR